MLEEHEIRIHGAQLLFQLIFATSDEHPKGASLSSDFRFSFSCLSHHILFLLTAATRAHAATASPH
jgi:hypothetical protein